jgi:hypothetical protein
MDACDCLIAFVSGVVGGTWVEWREVKENFCFERGKGAGGREKMGDDGMRVSYRGKWRGVEECESEKKNVRLGRMQRI